MTNKEKLIALLNNCDEEQLAECFTNDMEPLEKLFGHKLPCWGNKSQFKYWCNQAYDYNNYPEDNTIEIELFTKDKDNKCLWGEDTGRKYFTKQIKGKVDYYKPFGIKFPKTILNFSTSFVIGLLKEIQEEIGVLSLITNLTTNEEIIKKITII